MSFTEKQLKHIRKIKKAFDKLQQLYEEQTAEFTLHVEAVSDDFSGDPIAFVQLHIVSGSGKERILLTNDLVFTPETEQQRIFDTVKEHLEEVESTKASQENGNVT